MKNKYVRKIAGFLTQVLVCVILIMVIHIFWKGMYLIGIPKIEDVEKVSISYPQVCEEKKEVLDEKQIETAVKLTGFLKYSLFEKANLDNPPLITITYFTYDGKTIEISANRKTVWWKGKAHSIKEEDMFVNLTEGIFFLKDLIAE